MILLNKRCSMFGKCQVYTQKCGKITVCSACLSFIILIFGQDDAIKYSKLKVSHSYDWQTMHAV